MRNSDAFPLPRGFAMAPRSLGLAEVVPRLVRERRWLGED
jgi:hypothetical protein